MFVGEVAKPEHFHHPQVVARAHVGRGRLARPADDDAHDLVLGRFGQMDAGDEVVDVSFVRPDDLGPRPLQSLIALCGTGSSSPRSSEANVCARTGSASLVGMDIPRAATV